MPKTISKQHTGGPVDRELSKTAVEFITQKIPGGSDLLPNVRDLVGRCRDCANHRNTAPQKNECQAYALQMDKKIEDLCSHLDLMPEDFKALINEELQQLQRYGRYYEESAEILNNHLQIFRLMIQRASKEANNWNSMRGEKPKEHEHALLADVAGLIEAQGVPVTKAAELAAQLLPLCGFYQAPTNAKKAREAVLRSRKRRHPQD